MHSHPPGLTASEAERLLSYHGRNELQTVSRPSPFKIFIRQFDNALMLLLAVASIVSLAVGDWHDAFFIVLIIFLNAVLGFVQEYKAENALQSLRKMTVSKVRVVRDGIEQMIDSAVLVPGDIIKLEEGDKVASDGKVITQHHLEINEAALTGESLPVAKAGHDRIFMGTIVTSGSGVIQITATGKNTRFGQLAASLSTIQEQKTPLEKKIVVLGRQLTVLAVAITLLIFSLGLLQDRPLIEMALTSISLTVAAVPEGLPAVITIALAVGLQRMAKKRAIVRKLAAIEALGNTTVIVTDKTGTLTENKMRVVRIWTDNLVHKVTAIPTLLSNPTIAEILKTGIICNNASLVREDHTPRFSVIGDTTEGSLLLLAHDAGISISKIKKEVTVQDVFSFDQQKKLMSVISSEKDGLTLHAKGAPESILKYSSHILLKGKPVLISPEIREGIALEFEKFAKEGLRILALAKRPLKEPLTDRDDAEKDLTFIGIVGIADPPREEVRSVLQSAHAAGIRTIMVTGDNPLTAGAVGRHIGLIHEGDVILTGSELSKLTDEELSNRIDTIRIFARTTPQDKLRIVRILQKKGEIVTVTGDGVNDALALKQANTGVAMGITGTDVAKEVADMVITDDNFVSIVSAIREGRIIFDNIVKSITYLISTNLGEVFLILGTILASLFTPTPLPTPLLAVHILWINLVTDGLPALSLAFDRGSPHTMQPRPYTKDNLLLRKKNILFMLIRGTVIFAVVFTIFLTSLQYMSVAQARTITFNALVILQLGTIFFVREGHHPFSNKILIASIAVSFLLQMMIMFVPPFPTIFEAGSY